MVSTIHKPTKPNLRIPPVLRETSLRHLLCGFLSEMP